MVTSEEVVGEDPHARLRVVELAAPVPITEPRLVEWSEGFSLPTIVRNAFVPPAIEPSRFLPPQRVLRADIGRVGEFRDFNGEYPWSRIWSSMLEGQDVYGSFGTGTPNIDETTVGAIRRLKRTILPAEVYADDQNPGHVIFGSARVPQITTSWHNAIDANLLFQLHGSKDWYSIEQLPAGFHPVAISNFTYLVAQQGEGEGRSTLVDRGDEHERSLLERSAHAVLRAGDMLINTPYSWHAVRIDGFNLSLSLRGDRADVMAWLAFRYFGGQIDHPMLASFGSLLDTVTYGASRRRSGGADLPDLPDLPTVARALRKRLSILGGRVRSRLGLGEPFNPIIDSYAATDSYFQDLRTSYRTRFLRYLG